VIGNRQERTPHLHRCECPTIVQSCKCLLLVQFDNYYDPFYFPKPSNPPGIGAVAGRRRLRSTALLNEAISSAVRCHTIIFLTENARRIKFPEVICDNSLCNVFVISLEFLYRSGSPNVLKDGEVRVVCRRSFPHHTSCNYFIQYQNRTLAASNGFPFITCFTGHGWRTEGCL
jgi:hypothetical protein